jgi:hypothetical protein
MTSIRHAAVATLAGAALVLGGGAVAANAETTSTAAVTAATSCSFAQHLRQAWAKAPADLKSDLTALKAMAPGKARRADAVTIRTKALDGGYGTAVEVKAEWRTANTGERLRPLPANLRADLQTLRSDAKADKPAEAKKIADGALAGTYGAKVESFAKAVQSSTVWKDCAAS